MHIVGDVAAWGTDEPRWESVLPAELVDEHYYRSPEWFARNFHKYDSYDRSWPKVYCGEYAVTDGFGNLGNQNAALGEAIFMMGMENNADMVALSSYAPIFVNENDARWRPDMIRFNSRQVMGTPSYYVQKMMSESLGTRALKIGEKSMQILPENSSIRLPEASRIGVGAVLGFVPQMFVLFAFLAFLALGGLGCFLRCGRGCFLDCFGCGVGGFVVGVLGCCCDLCGNVFGHCGHLI